MSDQGSPFEHREPPDARTLGLSLDARYISAWNEINARIQGRDRILMTFCTLSVMVLGATYAERTFVRSLALIVPFLGVVATELLVGHENLIGLLSKHLGDIARAGCPGGVPNWDWHVGSLYVKPIYQRRRPMYWAHALAIGLLSGFALVRAWPGEQPAMDATQTGRRGLGQLSLADTTHVGAAREANEGLSEPLQGKKVNVTQRPTLGWWLGLSALVLSMGRTLQVYLWRIKTASAGTAYELSSSSSRPAP